MTHDKFDEQIIYLEKDEEGNYRAIGDEMNTQF